MIDTDLNMLPRRDNIRAKSRRKKGTFVKIFLGVAQFKNAKQVVPY